MSVFLLPALRGLEPYVPGEQPRDPRCVKLNTNESPYPPSPHVLDALSREQANQLNLYSDPTALPLRRAIAEVYGLQPENVFTGNGSDEVLAFAFLAYADAEHPVIIPEVSYGFYRVFAKLFGVEPTLVPVNEDFTLPVERFCHAHGMVVFANPNAPTGIALPLGEVERIVTSNAGQVVLVDEAYVDFGGESALALLERCPNLLIVRTFSKSRSLAGARLGYALAGSALIADLDRVRNSFHPYSINRLSMLAGIEAMRDRAYFTECTRKIIAQRAETAKELCALGFTMTASEANFLFAAHPRLSAKSYYEKLRERGVLVRCFGGALMREHVRITIGTREQMRRLVLETREILTEVQG
ncbi:MAG: histidinol-phosphate transaminase [Clostridia bacterium]